jgi:hypothetical protein
VDIFVCEQVLAVRSAYCVLQSYSVVRVVIWLGLIWCGFFMDFLCAVAKGLVMDITFVQARIANNTPLMRAPLLDLKAQFVS